MISHSKKNHRKWSETPYHARVVALVLWCCTVGPVSAQQVDELKFDYAQALHKSLLFYEAQRAGPQQSSRVPWRKPAALSDGSDVGLDLTGGWFDAGDHVKFGLPMSYSAAMLAWSVYESRETYLQTDELSHALNSLRFVSDYLVSAYIEGDPTTAADDRFVYQVGNPAVDHAFWGPPEDMTMRRPAYVLDADARGSEVVGGSAAALAAIALVFRDTDADYAQTLLDKAKNLYRFGNTYRGNNGYTEANGFYGSFSGFHDELAWAAIWLYLATNEESFLADSRAHIMSAELPLSWAHNWDNVAIGALVLLARVTDDSRFHLFLERHFEFWLNHVTYTAGGLAWLDRWGSLRYAANTAFIALTYANDVVDQNYATTLRRFAVGQINYILGDNPRGASYVVGYGLNAPRNPHHRAAHDSPTHNISNPVDNAHELTGALVGGPASADDFDWRDDRTDFVRNEVATDYNAAFTGALAHLLKLKGVSSNQDNNALPGDELRAAEPPAPELPGDNGSNEATNAALDVKVTPQSDWGNGYCADVTVTNPTNSEQRWEVTIDVDGQVSDVWSANWTQEGFVLNATGESWNAILKPAQRTTWGFCANRSEAVSRPEPEPTLGSPPITEEDPTSQPLPDAKSLSVRVDISSDWINGYCATVKVSNNDSKPEAWQVTFPVDGRIRELWNARWQQQGVMVTASGVSWNQILAANSNLEFGFCALR